MKVQIECTYCGHKWTEVVYHQSALEGKVCKNGDCKDRKLIVRDIKDKIDYYKGCPPFPTTSNDDKWRQFGMD